MSAATTWRFLRGLSKGLRLGRFFPTDGRSPARQAPQGSTRVLLSDGAAAPPGGLVRSKHDVELPGLGQAIAVLHITDTHLRGPAPWVDRLGRAIADTQPDLVLLTGDIVTRGWDRQTLDTFLDALPRAPLGRFAVMGNWEHWSGLSPASWARILARHDVRLLHNEIVQLDDLQICGTDDMLAGATDPATLRAQLVTARPTLVMSHSPGIFPALAGPGVDLVLSGHSHGGQVRLPGLGAVWVPRGTGAYVAGWYQQGGTHLFVSQGLGWSIAPLRVACPAELALLNLLPLRQASAS